MKYATMCYLKGRHCKYFLLCVLSGFLFFCLKLAQANEQSPSPESTVSSSGVCHQCHTLNRSALLGATLPDDTCGSCHDDRKEQALQLAVIADIDERLDVVGDQILRLNLSYQPRDSRFERAVEHYFTVSRMAEGDADTWSVEKLATMQASLFKAEVLLRLLENELHSGVMTSVPNVTNPLQVTLTTSQPMSKLVVIGLHHLSVLPVAAFSVQYLQAMALICLALALVQLLRHRAPPALFEKGVLQFQEISGIAVRTACSPCFFISVCTRRIYNGT